MVGNSARKFGDDIGGGRRYQQEVRTLGNGDMFDGAFKVGFPAGRITEEVSNDFLAAQSRKRQRGYELPRPARHHHLHAEAVLLQAAHEFPGLLAPPPTASTNPTSHS